MRSPLFSFFKRGWSSLAEMEKQFELRLTDMAHGGDALGRHEGKVIFVPYAIPGEEALVEIVEDKGRYARGRLVEILASPGRPSMSSFRAWEVRRMPVAAHRLPGPTGVQGRGGW
jgi:predicted RNA-binding protein with TRAM domain